MTSEFILLLIILITGFVTLAFLIRRGIQQKQIPDQLVNELLKSFDTRSADQTKEIREQTRVLNDRLQHAATIMTTVQKNIGEFSEIGRQMRDLQDFIKSPKLRGSIGEEVLADLITQMFPRHSFSLQYTFKTGARVDAAIKTDAGILPIDAKFPLENFQKMVSNEMQNEREVAKRDFIKDVRKHIETIAAKYILPHEGTMDFALMYVPSEAVFYEIVQMNELMRFAKTRRVYPVSPTTLYAHLQTILLSFAGHKIEAQTREIFTILRSMNGDYEKLQANLSVLGKHIHNAAAQMSLVDQVAAVLGRKLTTTQTLQSPEDALTPRKE